MKLEEGGLENELRLFNTQFNFNVSESDVEFRERLVKSLTQEIAQIFIKMNSEIDKKIENGDKESGYRINAMK